MSQREHWGSRIGFVLAAAGSAIGLGNLWKFPYITWNNHGGAFVLVYLLCIALIGMPLMMGEILVGRRAQVSPVPAYSSLGFPRWAFVGWLGVVAGIVILSFYVVIAGWSISSFIQCLRWSFSGYQAPVDSAFGLFVANGPLQILLALVFLAMTALIVSRGVSAGIERASRIMMPVLFVIMLYMVGNVMSLPSFGKALQFLFRPNFAELEGHAVLEALGHAFFTLSLGMGAMMTYGSYMSRGESVVKSAAAIVVLDTAIALCACIIMYSIIFNSSELQEQLKSGRVGTTGMLFVTLPKMFYTSLPGGAIIGPIFFILVGFAALTSTISLLEVVTALLVDKKGMPRGKATFAAAGGIGLMSVAAALSLGASPFLSNLKLFGPITFLNRVFTVNKQGVLAILDHISANWLLPMGGLLFTLFLGWSFRGRDAAEELDMVGSDGRPTLVFQVWHFLIRFICPAVIGYIIYKVLTGTDFS
jgi:NSS family neurotransmitter:Na+ symporter